MDSKTQKICDLANAVSELIDSLAKTSDPAQREAILALLEKAKAAYKAFQEEGSS